MKHNKDKMVHGTFIEECLLEILEELGLCFDVNEDCLVGVVFLNYHLREVTDFLYILGLTYEVTGDYSSGVTIKTTGFEELK